MEKMDAAEQHRLQLDGQIAVLRAETQHLLRQRNALAPIASLPTEVLAEVFVILRDVVYAAFKSEAPSLWRSLTHTCQAWRFVAIQCPRLWSVVDFHRHNVPWSLLMIARARSTPLSITVRNLLSFQEEEVMTQVAGCMPTVHELSVELGHAMNPTVRALFMSAPAPMLETINVISPEGRCGRGRDFPLDCVFNSETPRLKSVTVACAEMFWKSSIFLATSITSLDISIMGESNPPILAQGRQGLLMVLCTLQHLEELRMSADVEDGPLPPTKKTHMPRLRALELSGHSDFMASILECIILPVSVHLRLDVWNSQITPSLSDVIQKHCEALASDGSVPMHSVHLVRRNKDEDEKDWTMRAWHSNQGGDTQSSPDGTAWLYLACRGSRMLQGVFLEQIAHSFEHMLANTQDVWVVLGQGVAFASSWSTLFVALPAVETFRMVGFNPPCFQALAADTSKNGRLPLPALRDVTFYDACFHRGQMVVPWLDARQQLGFEIDSISMVRCTHGWTTVEEEAFRDAVHSSVGDVIWWDLGEASQYGA
jgi:hypothetical protein